MKKKDDKIRNIAFFSSKNGRVMTVHSEMAKQYAQQLETDDTVICYETDVPLTGLKSRVSSVGFRKGTLDGEWTSDFMVVQQNQLAKIIEIVDEEKLEEKRWCSEQLELSRRYWKAVGVPGWKTVIMKRGRTAW